MSSAASTRALWPPSSQATPCWRRKFRSLSVSSPASERNKGTPRGAKAETNARPVAPNPRTAILRKGNGQSIKGRGHPGSIGRLQKNKARRALSVFDWLQTLDSLPLAERLERLLAETERKLPVLVQVNIGREPQKAGVPPEELFEFVARVAALPHLEVRGLMAIPPAPARPEDSRPHFRAMRRLFEELRAEGIPGTKIEVLSMGMSADWEIAVEEGATMVRLGTALFGPRG